MKNKKRLRNNHRPEETIGKHDGAMHHGPLHCIMEQKEDINGKMGEIQIESGVYLIVMY